MKTQFSKEPVRFSALKRFDESAEHYLLGYPEENSELRKGTGLHAYLLGGESKIAIYEGGARNPNFRQYQAFLEDNPGKHILIPSELAKVEGMRRAVERHQFASELLDDGVQENRITWTTKGRACAGTPDVVKPKSNGKKRLVELKACFSSKPYKFRWHARDMHYDGQVDWYGDGLEKCLDYAPGPVDETYIVAVGMKPPHCVVVYRARESFLKRGRGKWQGWFDELLACERAGEFPGYVPEDCVVDLEDEGDDGLGLDWGSAAE